MIGPRPGAAAFGHVRQGDLNQARSPEFHTGLDAGCGLRAVSLLEIRAQFSIA
jgi:hypothetical protein